MKVNKRVLDVRFELLSPDYLRVDLIGMAHCLIAGVPHQVSIQVIRTSSTEVKCAFPVLLDSDGAPEWLGDHELREEIEDRVQECIAQAVAQEECGESGAAQLLGVEVMTTSCDLHQRGIVSAALVHISTEPKPLMLMLMVGDEDRLHIVYAVRFQQFTLPPSLEYPSMRKAIKDAIYDDVMSWPGAAKACRP